MAKKQADTTRLRTMACFQVIWLRQGWTALSSLARASFCTSLSAWDSSDRVGGNTKVRLGSWVPDPWYIVDTLDDVVEVVAHGADGAVDVAQLVPLLPQGGDLDGQLDEEPIPTLGRLEHLEYDPMDVDAMSVG